MQQQAGLQVLRQLARGGEGASPPDCALAHHPCAGGQSGRQLRNGGGALGHHTGWLAEYKVSPFSCLQRLRQKECLLLLLPSHGRLLIRVCMNEDCL